MTKLKSRVAWGNLTLRLSQIQEMSPVAAAELDGMANSFQYDRILQIVKKRKKDRNLEA